MFRRRVAIAAIAFLFISVAPFLRADTLSTSQAHSIGTFVSDQSALVPGSTLRLGVRIQLEPEWHTYWLNPGDSASTAIFDFQLPEGYAASEIKYPVPHRIPVGPLMSIGYDDETLLFVDIKIPESERDSLGQSRVLRLSAEWLVCKEECIPAFFDFAMTLPLQSSANPTPFASLFDAAQASILAKTGEASFRKVGESIVLEIPARGADWMLQDVFAFPEMPMTNDAVSIEQSDVDRWHASLPFRRLDQEPDLLQILARWQNVRSQEVVGEVLSAKSESAALSLMLGFAFLGGLILNLMPCVFPVLALKLFSLVKAKEQSRMKAFLSQATYQFGVLVSFWLLAGFLLLARSGGSSLGWGFQLQEPLFVVFLVVLFFVMGLNFLGVVHFHFRHAGVGQALTQKQGLVGSFFTGVLAVIVASPCTAPFMGAAMGFALSQSPWEVLLVFSALGFGLGSPYLFFGVFPQFAKFLPRPGHWMNHLREFLAFPLFATAAWLLFVLGQQVGTFAMTSVLVGLVFIGLGAWAHQKFKGYVKWIWLMTSFTGLLGSLYFVAGSHPQSVAQTDGDGDWLPFSSEQLSLLQDKNEPVFINFTAAWCISCQVNEQTTFRSTEVRDYIRNKGIAMLKADWTNRDQLIGSILQQYGRVGVPLYLYFPPGSTQAVVLPEVLTPAIFKTYVVL